MKKRVLSLLLVLSTILTLLPVQAFAVDTANPFRDVRENDWCYDAVQYARVNGFFNGTTTTTFDPDGTMTRGMFVAVLGRMAGVDTENYRGASSFSDVREDAYYAPYVAWASKYGITTGTGDGKFSPYGLINRQQMAAFFVRYFDAFGVDYETGANIITIPADIDSVSPYARDAVLKLWRQGLLNGDGVNFNPGRNATRAQAATICHRADQAVETWYKEPGVPSERVKIDPATGEPYAGQTGAPAETKPAASGRPAASGGSGDSDRSDDYGGSDSSGDAGNTGGTGGTGNSGGSGDAGNTGGTGGTGNSGDSGGGAQTNYYEVQFALLGEDEGTDHVILPGASDYPDEVDKLYSANTPIASLPTPFAQNNRVFLGWYYDRGKEQPVQDGDTVNRNMTLYADVESLTELKTLETPGYFTKTVRIIDENNNLENFSLKLRLPGAYTGGQALADLIKAGLTVIDITAGNKTADFDAAPDGTVTVGWIPGHSYRAELKEGSEVLFDYGEYTDEQLQYVRVFNIVVEKTPVENLKLNSGVKSIPKAEVSGMSSGLEGLFQVSLTQENGETHNTAGEVSETGSFTYDGSVQLAVGDIAAIYEGKSPGDRNLANKDDKNQIVYVEITKKDGDEYTYKTAEAKDVLFTPDIIPVKKDNLTSAGSVTFDKNEFITPAPEMKEAYGMMGLNADTTVDAGDFIAIVDGKNVAYGRIKSKGTDSEDGSKVTYEYEAVDEAALERSMDLYYTEEQKMELTDEEIQGIQDSIQKQMEQSGFAEEASQYLVALALETDGFQELAEDFDIQTFNASFADGTPVKYSANVVPYAGSGAAKAAGGVTTYADIEKKVNIKVKLGDLDHFDSSKGIRVEVELSVTIPVGKTFEVELKAVFEQEVLLSMTVGGGAITHKEKFLGAEITIIDDYLMNASFDVGTYTGVGVTASAYTKGKDKDKFDWKPVTDNETEGKLLSIGKQITDLMKAKDKFLEKDLVSIGGDDDDDDDDGGIPISGSLTDRYAAMLEEAGDNQKWYELFRQEIFYTEGYADPFCILAYGASMDFVASVNLYVTLGVTFEYAVARQYSFSVFLFDKEVYSGQTDLEPEYYQLSVYVMGTMGLRVGLELEAGCGLFSLKADSVGFCAEVGAYAQLYGFFYYQLRWEQETGKKESSYNGALFMEVGAYLRVTFKAQLFSSKKLTYQPALYDRQWPILTLGNREYVYGFSDITKEGQVYTMKGVDKMTLPAEVFTLKYIDLRTGETGGGEDDKNPALVFYGSAIKDNFGVFLSNNQEFRYDENTNTITVNTNSITAECDATIYWAGGNLAFSSLPIERKIHIVYEAPGNYRYIAFDSQGGSYVPSIATAVGASINWPNDPPTRTGYDFKGWYTQPNGEGVKYEKIATMPDPPSGKGIDLYACWEPRTDINYKVEHYQQSLNGGYELADKDSYTNGVSGQVLTEEQVAGFAKTYEHFTFDPSRTPKTTVNAYGSTVLRLYYTRNSYVVTFKYGLEDLLDKAERDKYTPITFRVKYEDTLKAPILAVSGYEFGGYPGFEADADPEAGLHTVKGTETYTAKWDARTDIAYQIRHYLETADGSGYALHEAVYKNDGAIGEPVTAPENTYQHFTHNAEMSEGTAPGGVARDGSTVLRHYYDRDKYKVTLDPNGGTWPSGLDWNEGAVDLEFYYEQEIPTEYQPTNANDGFAFAGWHTADGKPFEGVVTGPATLYAWWGTGVNFNIDYYYMDVDGEYPTEPERKAGVGAEGDTITLSELKGIGVVIDSAAFTFARAEINGDAAEEATVTAGMTVALYYERNKYNVTWHLNEGTVNGNAGDVVENLYYGAELTAPNAVNTGYGVTWYEDKDFQTQWTGTGTVTGDMDFYAKWEKSQPYSVHYYYDGNTQLTGDGTIISNYGDLHQTYPDSRITGDKPVDAKLIDGDRLFIGWCTDPDRPSETMVTDFREATPTDDILNLYMVCLEKDSSYFPVEYEWQLWAMSNLSDTLKGDIKLADDFTLENWPGIGRFSGTFNGGGHTITLTGTTNPLFNIMEGEGTRALDLTIQLGVDGETVIAKGSYWGAIAGRADGVGFFKNCHVAGSVKAESSANGYYGGMIGYMSPENGGLENCTAGVSADKPLKMIGFYAIYDYGIGGLVGVMRFENSNIGTRTDSSKITYTGSEKYTNYVELTGVAGNCGGLVGHWYGASASNYVGDSRTISGNGNASCVVAIDTGDSEQNSFRFGGVIGYITNVGDMTFDGLTVTCKIGAKTSSSLPMNDYDRCVGALFGGIIKGSNIPLTWTANNVSIEDCEIKVTGGPLYKAITTDRINSILASYGVVTPTTTNVTCKNSWLSYYERFTNPTTGFTEGRQIKGTANSDGSITKYVVESDGQSIRLPEAAAPVLPVPVVPAEPESAAIPETETEAAPAPESETEPETEPESEPVSGPETDDGGEES